MAKITRIVAFKAGSKGRGGGGGGDSYFINKSQPHHHDLGLALVLYILNTGHCISLAGHEAMIIVDTLLM